MRILIIGGGGVGATLASKLSSLGHNVIVVDKDKDKIDRVTMQADVEGVVKDAADPHLYESLDLRTVDMVVAATDRDEINLFVAAISKMNNVKRVLVRVRNRETVRLLRMIGVDLAIPEGDIMANILLSAIEGRYSVVKIVEALAGEYAVFSRSISSLSKVVGQTLQWLEENLPPTTKIIGVFDGEKLREPESFMVLQPGYIVIMLASMSDVDKIMELFK